MQKKFVDVICLNDHMGNLEPLFLMLDESKKIPILKTIEVIPNSSVRPGESGLRYTCLFENNRTRHLFYDRGKWFVEMYR